MAIKWQILFPSNQLKKKLKTLNKHNQQDILSLHKENILMSQDACICLAFSAI